MNNTNTNVYAGFEDIVPYSTVLRKCSWLLLNPSPIGSLIEDRFSRYYIGKLTEREILSLKDLMNKKKEELSTYKKSVWVEMCDLQSAIKEQEKLCGSECEKILEEHLNICNSSYKCHDDYVAYECRFIDNGRCNHYYDIKYLKEQLENFEYVIDQYDDDYVDAEIKYKRASTIKRIGYEKYKEDLYDDY